MLDRLSERDRNLTRLAGEAAQEVGARAYLVGGAVRDLVLGREVTDLDLVATGDVECLAERLGRGLGSKSRPNRRFGTWSWRRPDGSRVDLARARRESYSRPGVLPAVFPADLTTDLARRDFTINAMALDLDLGPGGPGRIHDPFRGREDLERRRIRILDASSFVEDPTRLFRAIRFAGRLGFALEGETARAFRRAIEEAALRRVSATRIRRELVLLLSESAPLSGVKLAEAHQLWGGLHPRLRAGRAALQRLRALLYAVNRSGLSPSISRLPRWALLLGTLIEPLGEAAGRELLDRLILDRPARRMIEDVLTRTSGVKRRILRLESPTPSRVDAICRPAHPATLAVAWSYGPRRSRRLLVRWLREWSLVRTAVSGSDLLAAGCPPGPGIARGLSAARRAKLDGRAPARPEQLRVAIRRARRA